MKELSYKEKVAVLCVLQDILLADNKVHEKETVYMDDVALSIGFGKEYCEIVNDMSHEEAIAVIARMDEEQKQEVAKMMGKMIVVDEDINYYEVCIYNSICKSCGIDYGFSLDDYPEMTLSGPFEDLDGKEEMW